MKKNVLHIIDSFEELGGAETLLINYVKHFNEVNNIIVTLNPIIKKEAIDSGLQIFSLNHKSPFNLIRSIFKLRKIINNSHIDIIHAHLFWPIIISSIACPKRVKYIKTYHSNYFDTKIEKYGRLFCLLDKITNRNNFVSIVVSKNLNNELTSILNRNGMTILSNCLDDKFFSENTPGKKETRPIKCVAVGNLRKEKNYGFLIRNFKIFDGSKATLDIYGDGNKQEYEQLIVSNNISNIHLKGPSSDISNILPKYDLFIMASFMEGFGISLAEAMASNIPLFVSDIPVFKEVTGGYAIFFKSNDTSSFHSEFRKIINNEYDLTALTKNAYIYSLNYKRAPYIEKLKKIYFD